jgi:DNA polymerase elongation subunit (family B)
MRIIRTLKTERIEIRCDFNNDNCYFRYLVDRAINRKKSITLDRES